MLDIQSVCFSSKFLSSRQKNNSTPRVVLTLFYTASKVPYKLWGGVLVYQELLHKQTQSVSTYFESGQMKKLLTLNLYVCIYLAKIYMYTYLLDL